MEERCRLCGICEAMVLQRGMLDCCDHIFCSSCIEDWATVSNLCPLCKNQFKFLTLVNVKTGIVDQASNAQREEESFSYLIDEEAITCLDGDECKLRSGKETSIDFEDTSVACDGCDQWYHASCVGFDPGKPGGRTWHCPRCSGATEKPATVVAPEKPKNAAKNASSLAFTFTESGESAVVVSMVGDKAIQSEVVVRVEDECIVASELVTTRSTISAEPAPLTVDFSADLRSDVPDAGSLEVPDQVGDAKSDLSAEPTSAEVKAAAAVWEPVATSAEPAAAAKSELEQLVEKMKMEGLLPDTIDDPEPQHEVEEPEQEPEPEPEPEDEVEKMEVDEPEATAKDPADDGAQAMEVEEDAASDTSIEELLRIVESASLKVKQTKETKEKEIEDAQEVRTRMIMRRDGEKTNDKSLAETLRLQMISTAGYGGAEMSGGPRPTISDEQFLAAYKAAMVNKEAVKPKKVRFDNARKNLKRKLYGGGRQIYDRDWDVAFWRNKVLSDKRRKTEADGGKSELEEAIVQEAPAAAKEPVYVADCSLLPRGDAVKKPEDKPRRAEEKPRRSEDKPTTSSLRPSKSTEKPEPGPEPEVKKETPEDKRKWALELLARKNKSAAKPSSAASAGHLLRMAQLPDELRPVVERLPRCKVPVAVRQSHLNRFVEHYLKDVHLGNRQACEEAVNAAVAKEKEICDRSNSKGVYINLCVQALKQPPQIAAPEPDPATEEETIAQALLAAGLVSDSPPGSPTPNDAIVAPAHEEARMEDVKLVTGNRGITALLEHLNKEATVKNSESEVSGKSAEENESKAAPALAPVSSPAASETPALEVDLTQGELLKADSEGTLKDDLLDDCKFESIDNRMNRVRSNIAQQLSENKGNAPSELMFVDQKADSNPTSRAKEHSRRSSEASKGEPSHKSRASSKTSSSAEPNDGSKEHPIKKQVELYIKEHIRPLYKSGVIRGEQYQWTVAKTTAKVLEYHKDTISPEFLITEGSRVKKLAEQYLQRYPKGHENK